MELTAGLERKLKIGVFFIFAGFYLYLLCQFFQVFIYYDDYGYLSLSYGYLDTEVMGSDYHVCQALNYMRHHYSYTNGRLLYLFLYQLLYLAGGLRLVQIFMATAVMAVIVLSYKLVIRHFEESYGRERITFSGQWMLALFLCFLYGFIGIKIQRIGTYWFAAAFLYVVPAITVLCFCRMYYETIEREKSVGWWAGCMLLAFLGSFSQEQWMVAEIAVIVTGYGYKHYRYRKAKEIAEAGRIGLRDIGVLAAAVAGALPILTSPAVRERMGQNTRFAEHSFLENVLYNIPVITRLFFDPGNQKYIVLFLIVAILMTMVMIKKNQGIFTVHLLSLAGTFIVGCYLFAEIYILHHKDANGYPIIAVWLLFGYILWISAQIIYFLFRNNHVLQGMIYIGGFMSMACLVIVPEMPYRVLLPYIFLSFSFMGYVFAESFLTRGRMACVTGGMFLVSIMIVGSSGMRDIYEGYHANWNVHQYNDAKLRENGQRIHQGEDITEIHLYRLLDDMCANEMAYDPNFSFMVYWMAQYYDLPEHVELIYDVITDMEHIAIP